ncbi:nucleotidyltransferase domain-containing protein [Methylocystis echinoides]|uniref:Nucleotidyltransferase n=1 Tax=Methylocystis echinoides TaxID=29468 RepID=A0A9W6H094_9HYPH|nr:nucleotidyltransferase [Methylocystis echinoides]GLI96060.1 nucleotidyltransferase [Methylocystis echinoides]
MLARFQVFTLLERICQELDLTETQHEQAKKSYEAVGEWLAAASDPLLVGMAIRPQGSMALRTAVKPISECEHDVDLISFAPRYSVAAPPGILKQAIGARLKDNGTYARLLEEKPRCWRLNYAGEFHLDITPSIRNPDCVNGGELVPEKGKSAWKATNPEGYRKLFERRGALQPRLRLTELAKDSVRARADSVAPLPERSVFKSVLCRIVQICKRHRDVYFSERDSSLAPISVIITTLLSRSYEACVKDTIYDSEFDVLLDVITRMRDHINQFGSPERPWIITNETTKGENFAEKWSANPALPVAFFEWHKRAVADIVSLKAVEGLDRIQESLTRSFGSRPVKKAMDAFTQDVSKARNAGVLSVAPVAGLTSNTAAAHGGTSVKKNTFYGGR